VRISRLFSISMAVIALGCVAAAQQNDPSNRPSVTLDNKGKPPKESTARTILGVVKDASDNPVSGALVQLKDTKTSEVVSFPTKEDGRFTFRDLSMNINYELLAKRGDITTPVKKVTMYDTRKNVVVNFQLLPPKQP